MVVLTRIAVRSVVAAAGLFAPTAVAKPKPDLVVKTIPLRGRPYVVNGETADENTRFEFAVVNRGDRPAHKSLARVQLVHSRHGSFKLGYREIPADQSGRQAVKSRLRTGR